MNPMLLQLLFSLAPKIIDTIHASGKPAPGYQSTEFWLTSIVGLWAALSPAVPAPYSFIIPSAAAGLYGVLRTLLKAAHLMGKATALPELPDLSALTTPAAPAPKPVATQEQINQYIGALATKQSGANAAQASAV